ncbi:SgcJ/EcaC family oxidoreductase [Streptomyces sp. NRRL B-1347]|uniref:SgcJ/EcaC family oxidoreductase n=1 Tax=Streptomyces sp. NRRL B-1347 TaxID=1476877 RepID=UPI0004C873F2|nr:SgcJ/EcaC family oxidoreductase [Streptomyces sp. NRRL B-1347]
MSKSTSKCVDELLAGMARAWNEGDGAALAAHFAEDADFVDVVGRFHRGRAVIAEEHQKIFDTVYRGSRLAIRLLDGRPLADGLLLLHTATTLHVPEGPRAGELHGIRTQIVRDAETDGKILAFHNSARTDLADFAHDDEDMARRSPREWHGQGSHDPDDS